jgi:hypothetical protein
MEEMRTAPRTALFAENRTSEAGSVTFPLLLLVVVLTGAMLACLSIGLLWRRKVKLQLRLDACVEKTALELESIQTQIESANRRMRIERAAALAAAGPTAGASLRAAKVVLTAEMVYQEVLRAKWRARQALWIAQRGCDRKSDAFLPLPSLEWWRPPEDPVGPSALEWQGSKEGGLAIRLWNGNRFSAARVAVGTNTLERKWRARWIAPLR